MSQQLLQHLLVLPHLLQRQQQPQQRQRCCVLTLECSTHSQLQQLCQRRQLQAFTADTYQPLLLQKQPDVAVRQPTVALCTERLRLLLLHVLLQLLLPQDL
jgi:hypothetical protein